MTAMRLKRGDCTNLKDSNGDVIHIGDKVVRTTSDGAIGRNGEIGWVHDSSHPDERGIRIRVSDCPNDTYDYIWSSWSLPEHWTIAVKVQSPEKLTP